MKRLLPLLLVLAGCATPSRDLPEPTWSGRVEWIETDAPSVYCDDLLGVRSLKFGTPSAGCYKIKPDGTCLIITDKMRREADFVAPGHELYHCKRGKFHDSEGKRY